MAAKIKATTNKVSMLIKKIDNLLYLYGDKIL